MPRKEIMAVPEGNGPIPQYVMPGGITLEDFRQALSEMRGNILIEFEEDLRSISQRLASLEHGDRQPRLAMEADGPADKKTREHTEGAVKAVQAMHGDSFSANRVQAGPKTTSTSFGVKAKPPALPCRDDVVVENGAAAPKSCISPLEMRTTTTVGGLLPTGKTTTASSTTFDHSTLVLPDRRDDFEDFSSIRLVQQQFLEKLPACCPLLPEGH